MTAQSDDSSSLGPNIADLENAPDAVSLGVHVRCLQVADVSIQPSQAASEVIEDEDMAVRLHPSARAGGRFNAVGRKRRMKNGTVAMTTTTTTIWKARPVSRKLALLCVDHPYPPRSALTLCPSSRSPPSLPLEAGLCVAS